MTLFHTAVWMLCALGVMAPASHAQVVLRGGKSIEAPVDSVSTQGVQIGGDDPRIISWDRVRSVVGEHAEESAQYMQLAEQAWRARTRLARGDILMSQPLFEELFSALQHEDGPTALVVARGLLQCRLANLAQASAVEPWLETVRLGRRSSLEEDGSSIIDPETGLAPRLPPVWLAGPPVETLVSKLSPAHSDDPKTQRLRALYRMAAQQTLGRWDGHIAPQDDPGAALIASMISAVSDDPDVRASSRRRLHAGLSREPGGWKEAWRRVALGRSLLMEESPALRRQGMIHLLHVPARFQTQQPYLAGVALAIVADELRAQGDVAGAQSLIEALKQVNSAHPALSWWNHRQSASPPVRQSETPIVKKKTNPNFDSDATSRRLATDKERP